MPLVSRRAFPTTRDTECLHGIDFLGRMGAFANLESISRGSWMSSGRRLSSTFKLRALRSEQAQSAGPPNPPSFPMSNSPFEMDAFPLLL